MDSAEQEPQEWVTASCPKFPPTFWYRQRKKTINNKLLYLHFFICFILKNARVNSLSDSFF